MFTGIIEEIGRVKKIENGAGIYSLYIEASDVLAGTRIGDSIAVNGVCLTVTKISGGSFVADVMPETLRRSNLKLLSPGSYVNLERAMAANGRFGGHIVSGHVDGTGTICHMEKEENAVWVTVACGRGLLKYIIEKGSITIDGISLTVAYTDDTCFKVSIIPHTAKETTLLFRKKGDIVNLENDMLGKYVDRMLNWDNDDKTEDPKSGINIDFLTQNGFMN